ncbi:MAG: hypothetical protein LBU32_22700 [Clostridiales bacterium]|nr:hypothetical protein [Clostridiales bacterium]
MSFDDRFIIERMDYRFLCQVVKQYQTDARFIELLCLDSAEGLNLVDDGGEFSIV